MGQHRKALICGVSGQDGAQLAALLLDRGYEVVGTTRSGHLGVAGSRASAGLDRLKVVSLELSEAGAVESVVREVRPAEVYNVAGQSSVALSFAQPVETFRGIALGTMHLLEAIRTVDRSIRLFNAGSGEVFGDTHGAASTEGTPFAPRSPYASSKAAAYWAVASFREAWGLHASTGILFNHESASRPERFVTRKIVAAAVRIAGGSRETLYLGNIAVQRDWGWAPEFVEAMWRMVQADEPGDLVLATGETRPLSDFICLAFAGVGLDWRQHVKSDLTLSRPTDLAVMRADPTRARERIGWQARTRMEGVVRKMLDAEIAALALPIPRPEHTIR